MDFVMKQALGGESGALHPSPSARVPTQVGQGLSPPSPSVPSPGPLIPDPALSLPNPPPQGPPRTWGRC